MKSRKELVAEYQQMKKPIGVFQIRNLSNGKVFIDSSNNITSKWNRHKMELKFGSHRHKTLQNDWNDLGEDQFVLEFLSELKIEDDDDVNIERELQLLFDMVVEELNLSVDQRY
ncbi:hypothetical protein GCM10025777_03140 [Membranihabitans marinus]